MLWNAVQKSDVFLCLFEHKNTLRRYISLDADL